MKEPGSSPTLSPAAETLLEGLVESLRESVGRWRTLDRQGIRATFQELRKQRREIIRQEGLHPPNDPLRLSFQCQKAVVDLHILELRKGAGEKRVKVLRVW